MTLVLSYWLGLLDASNTHELHPEAIGTWERIIEKAYQNGQSLTSEIQSLISNRSNARIGATS